MDIPLQTKHTLGKLCKFITLGCKVNQYETQYVKEMLEANGYHEAESHEQADLCVVNTCTVTAEGDAKSRQAIRKLARQNPSSQIIVMGCYATREPETVAKLPRVATVITDKARIADEFQPLGVLHIPVGIRRFDGHSRAFVKVQDGCLLNCSYCIIPKVRPILHSRPINEICAEVRQLVESGFQEIVLTGVHLGHYGIDLSRGKAKHEWSRLWHLLDALERVPGRFRIRLSSLEAAEVPDDLVRAIANNSRVVPHLHLCLQSGSNRILRAMKRRYTAEGFMQRCKKLREALDLPALTTDIIVGFPSETEDDFAATCKLAREVGFSKIHVFSYSPRHGTKAVEDYTEPIEPAIVADRRARLHYLERELALAYHRQLVGRRLEVLVEGEAPGMPGYVMGTSCRYAQVVFPGVASELRRTLVSVMATEIAEDKLVGMIDPSPMCNLGMEQSKQHRPSRLGLPLCN